MKREQPPIIPAPPDAADRPQWRTELVRWREGVRTGLDFSAYDDPAFTWTRGCFCCGMVMTWDERFMDHARGRLNVPAVVADGQRFGGYDAVVLWHAYPRIGFDDRNQFDYYRELPALRSSVEAFHRHGIRVFIDYNPWDTGTRRTGHSDAQACAATITELGADGIFLDTLAEGDATMRRALDLARPGVALESELALPIAGLPAHHLSWAQWFDSAEAPGVLRDRYVEQRHMMHFIRRWDASHAGELQLAWMNGAGLLVWENIFGSWNGWSAQDQATLSAMLPIQRALCRWFTGGAWTPLVETILPHLFASEWTRDGIRVWTVVNRSDSPVDGPVLEAALGSHETLIDLFTGEPTSRFRARISANGIGGFLALPRGVPNPLTSATRVAPVTPVRAEPVLIRPIATTRVHPSRAPGGFITVAAGEHTLVTKFRQRECGERGYAPTGGPADLHAEFDEHRTVKLEGFAVMRQGVTNGEYAAFASATGYRPRSADNFLRHLDAGQPGPGDEGAPVRYVNIADARAYAEWKGWRLPTDAEWQLAMEREPSLLVDQPLWNWTSSEYDDGRTRFVILKGGAAWRAIGSDWYADSGPHGPDFAAKFIEIWAGLDRCATIGFRCAVSLPSL